MEPEDGMTQDEMNRLADSLQALYPTREDLISIVQRAGMDPARVPMSGSVANMWQAVVREAHLQARTSVLVAQARSDYPHAPALVEDTATVWRGEWDVPSYNISQDRRLAELDTRTAIMQVDINYIKARVDKMATEPPDYNLFRAVVALNTAILIGVLLFLVLQS